MDKAETQVRQWLRDCVVALDLCPFAAPVLRDQSLRIAVSTAASEADQLQDFLRELDRLQASPEAEIATTLLVLSRGPAEFEDFLDLVDAAQQLLEEAGLEGTLQLAHFHPAYCFAGEDPAGVSHLTNRSPLPVIHLLRESMLSRAVDAYPDTAAIPQRNIERLESLSPQELQRRWSWLTLA
ncbi:MAG: DUF1415 domain-containing protein [Halieaceae bacterium]